MNELVLDVTLLVLALSLPAWLALSLAIVFGRVRYERSHREVTSAPLSDRAARRWYDEPVDGREPSGDGGAA